ncbi:TetR/AcrR family transcriptional regulator [Actinocorallia sp. A-T 12471]|uniref:TetR/AcrR family transcriptional regulator n=1 Tax=Actinocorallia sp. A-T 12471 TaxID=3089813 RepID=UPI0029CCF96A|nr:TetR/AcrR family transcriptional regulator [Actinocorallia sp. A-T 12471]MDX6740946.1 TetR/AcrR family transcriptional regulator [Actinocorallia sp. A-T 12471]
MSGRSLRDERREQRRALSRDQILDVAEQVFARKGFHDASLREIAELADYSVGAVYGFFSGKDELYREIFHRRTAAFMPEMAEVLASDLPADLRLVALAEWQVGFFRRYPEFGRLVLRGGAIASPVADPPEEDTETLANFRRSLDMQAELFRTGQRAGLLRDGDPVLMARMFSGLVSAFQTSELSGGAHLPLGVLVETVERAFRA